ncbi:hypothetical protein B0H17DRAFT_1181965 [Mycena rosella]|uniref:Uncharacterized protein n=1 Tax=Mycena rosella TaxID=1033263 RepID=A0AAD7D6J1_MYCRO|nr:hypothetical protein B0H17DRAFT_1181965 [Mycena rosella]
MSTHPASAPSTSLQPIRRCAAAYTTTAPRRHRCIPRLRSFPSPSVASSPPPLSSEPSDVLDADLFSPAPAHAATPQHTSRACPEAPASSPSRRRVRPHASTIGTTLPVRSTSAPPALDLPLRLASSPHHRRPAARRCQYICIREAEQRMNESSEAVSSADKPDVHLQLFLLEISVLRASFPAGDNRSVNSHLVGKLNKCKNSEYSSWQSLGHRNYEKSGTSGEHVVQPGLYSVNPTLEPPSQSCSPAPAYHSPTRARHPVALPVNTGALPLLFPL